MEIIFYVYIFGFWFAIFESLAVIFFIPWVYSIGFSVFRHRIKMPADAFEKLEKETIKTEKGKFRIKGNRIYAKNRYHKETQVKGVGQIDSSDCIEFHFRTMLGTPLILSSFSVAWLKAIYNLEDYNMMLIMLVVIILSFFWTYYVARRKAKRLIDEFIGEIV